MPKCRDCGRYVRDYDRCEVCRVEHHNDHPLPSSDRGPTGLCRRCQERPAVGYGDPGEAICAECADEGELRIVADGGLYPTDVDEEIRYYIETRDDPSVPEILGRFNLDRDRADEIGRMIDQFDNADQEPTEYLTGEEIAAIEDDPVLEVADVLEYRDTPPASRGGARDR